MTLRNTSKDRNQGHFMMQKLLEFAWIFVKKCFVVSNIWAIKFLRRLHQISKNTRPWAIKVVQGCWQYFRVIIDAFFPAKSDHQRIFVRSIFCAVNGRPKLPEILWSSRSLATEMHSVCDLWTKFSFLNEPFNNSYDQEWLPNI
jgi:hypothetical protein